MSQNPTGQVSTAAVCAECGAEQRSDRQAACWLCGAPTAATAAGARQAAAAVPPSPTFADGRGYSFSLSTLLLVVTLAAILCGLMTIYPGVGVIVSILLAPVLVRTAKVVRRREAAGVTVSAAEKVALGVTSFGAAVVIATVVGFATFCCFCATCATFFGVSMNAAELLWLAAGAGFGAVAAIFVAVKLVKWSVRRYRRDIDVTPPRAGE
ncbi:MAG: hypothetical protein DCC67_06915 [Planctomycetota bacterium]|nr:MAG: hypothetical protein DCC67_06915 [Planctomycetota bacterium]